MKRYIISMLKVVFYISLFFIAFVDENLPDASFFTHLLVWGFVCLFSYLTLKYLTNE